MARLMGGPWSDLPPADPPKRDARARWRPTPRRGQREPIIQNWRGLLIVLFLLFVAPILANWLSHVIMGMVSRGG